ncbi:hypothetical protein BD560DRAFT_425011 [Blakeslea trispora]|nr:hypothetical protein BD560DRAFT_425011 [Blakeslea trispora]
MVVVKLAILYKLKLESDNVKQERTLIFLNEVLFQIESKQFMLSQNNSERDYVYQLWFPVLTKLFFINNVIRIKTKEIVLAGTTFETNSIIEILVKQRFSKVDARILRDYNDEKFDLMCGEAFHDDDMNARLTNDAYKLIRES